MARRAAHGQTEIAKLTRVEPASGSTNTLLFMSSGKVLRNTKPRVGPSLGWKLNKFVTDLVRESNITAVVSMLTSRGWQLEFNHDVPKAPRRAAESRTLDQLEAEILEDM